MYKALEMGRGLNSRLFGNSDHPQGQKRSCKVVETEYHTNQLEERNRVETRIQQSLPAPLMPLTVHRVG